MKKHEYHLNFAGEKEPNKFPYKELPEIWRDSTAITQRKGTLWFEEHGSIRDFTLWIREITIYHSGNLIPLQWAADYARVSRAAVLNKAKRGELFVFSFVVTDQTNTIAGKNGNRQTRQRYDYVLISQLHEWRQDLYDRYNPKDPFYLNEDDNQERTGE